MHKRLLFLTLLATLLIACSKGDSAPPPLYNDDLVGRWHCVRYVSDTTDIATSGLYYEFHGDGSYVITKDEQVSDNGNYSLQYDGEWNILTLTPYYAEDYGKNIYYRVLRLNSKNLTLQETIEGAKMYFEKIIATSPR